MDEKQIREVLSKNYDKDFVKRIVNPEKYPVLDLGNGDYATHKMAWAEAKDNNGKTVYRVYPTILYDGSQLIDYGDKAYEKVIKTGDYIDFNDPKDADDFSKNYKTIWQTKGK